MRQVSPTILPLRLRIAEMRWSVRSMPARLSSPNDADVLDDVGDVAVGDLAVEQRDLRRRVARLGPAAQVQDDLDQRLPVRQGMDRLHDLRRQRRQEDVEVVHGLALALGGSHADRPSFVVGHLDVVLRHRTPAGTRRGSATLTRVSFISSVTVAIEAKPSSSSRRSIGDS